QVGIRRSLPRHLRVGPQPAGGAEPVNDHVNIAGNPPHRQLGHRGAIRRAHRLVPPPLPPCHVRATLLPSGQPAHAPIMTARPRSHKDARTRRTAPHPPATSPPPINAHLKGAPSQAPKEPSNRPYPSSERVPPAHSPIPHHRR